MSPKQLVLAFYQSDAWKNEQTFRQFIHPDYQQFWHYEGKFIHYNFEQCLDHSTQDLAAKFATCHFEISHCIAEGNQVFLRYLVKTSLLSHPDEEKIQAAMMALWEVKDGKLYRCWEMGVHPDNSEKSINSFAEDLAYS